MDGRHMKHNTCMMTKNRISQKPSKNQITIKNKRRWEIFWWYCLFSYPSTSDRTSNQKNWSVHRKSYNMITNYDVIKLLTTPTRLTMIARMPQMIIVHRNTLEKSKRLKMFVERTKETKVHNEQWNNVLFLSFLLFIALYLRICESLMEIVSRVLQNAHSPNQRVHNRNVPKNVLRTRDELSLHDLSPFLLLFLFFLLFFSSFILLSSYHHFLLYIFDYFSSSSNLLLLLISFLTQMKMSPRKRPRIPPGTLERVCESTVSIQFQIW